MAWTISFLGNLTLLDPLESPWRPSNRVTFDIDANGLVNVSAKDKATGKEQQIRIQASGGLSDDDIDRMVNEAEQHADDKERRETVEVRNNADALVHSTEKNLQEFGDKITEEERGSMRVLCKPKRLSAVMTLRP